ncbi:MAG: hypothetical protein QOE36_3795 [Gaiellaceae bacterium]|jgi:hypothetical protein|nr:hypothetical protein [Gaiellaceae bacterium]
MAVAPPYVAYSTATVVHVPAWEWEVVYPALQAMKGHVQEYPGCQSFDAFVAAGTDGQIHLHSYTTWDTAEQRDVYLERGYTLERLLKDLDVTGAERSLVMEKVF